MAVMKASAVAAATVAAGTQIPKASCWCLSALQPVGMPATRCLLLWRPPFMVDGVVPMLRATST